MRGELALALEVHARAQGAPRAVLGLRDILDVPEAIRKEWRRNGYSETIVEHYTTVLCYGDRAVYDPVSEYGLPAAVAERVEFTGYLADDVTATLAPEIRLRHAPEGRLAVCTLGGGKDAAAIAEAFMGAVGLMAESSWVGVMVTGPYMADHDVAKLRDHPAAGRVELLKVVDDIPSYLAAADAAVCMGGYNTACEVLALAVPAVMIPRVAPRLEQRMRAELLGDRGLVRWIDPSVLSDDLLAGEIESAAADSRPLLAANFDAIAHDGLHKATELLAAQLPTGPGSRRAARAIGAA
jgi:predicted glycosyltransferase